MDDTEVIERGTPEQQPAAASGAQTAPLVCPECGTPATVAVNRRDAGDFCAKCDFPLFWAPSAVVRDPAADAADDSLRRLPGTVGRATLASMSCPHCAEPNPLAAQVCVRCGQPMHLASPPPSPTRYVPPLPSLVEPVPDRGVAWWVWVLLGFLLVLGTVLIVLVIKGAI